MMAMAEEVASLCVVNKDGTTVVTPLNNVGKVEFGAESFTVKSKAGEAADYKYGEVSRVDLGKLSSLASAVRESTLAVWPTVTSSTLNVGGEVAGQTAEVYSISGARMFGTELKEGINKIDFSSFTSGIYILKVGKNSVKIIKK